MTIFEDLTVPRQKLLRAVRDLSDTDFAFVKEGSILARRKDGKFIKVDSADDLFHLGGKYIVYKDFYEA